MTKFAKLFIYRKKWTNGVRFLKIALLSLEYSVGAIRTPPYSQC